MTLKEKITIASLRLFSTKGFMSTSISDIMAEAGASKGGLYNHFKNKDQLFYAALSEARSIWRDKNLDGIEDINDPIEKIVCLFKNYQHRYLTSSDLPGGCIFVNLAIELNDQRPDLATHVNQGFDRLKVMVKKYLDQAKEKKLIASSANTTSITQMLVSGLLGACVMYTSDKSKDNLNETISPIINYLYSIKS